MKPNEDEFREHIKLSSLWLWAVIFALFSFPALMIGLDKGTSKDFGAFLLICCFLDWGAVLWNLILIITIGVFRVLKDSDERELARFRR